MSRNCPVPHYGPVAVGSTLVPGTILPSALRAEDLNSGDGAGVYVSAEYANYDHLGLRIFLDITTNSSNTGTVTVKVQCKDPVSDKWMDLAGAVTPAVATCITSMLTIYPGNTETANVDVATPLGCLWRIVATVATADCTFSVGGEYLG